jgi:nucleotide-binding universal stress UspA family protein
MDRHSNEPSNLGERLLALAQNVGAELLVMGCYRRSRMRELVLGGVTRTVLKSMRLPVLMAH